MFPPANRDHASIPQPGHRHLHGGTRREIVSPAKIVARSLQRLIGKEKHSQRTTGSLRPRSTALCVCISRPIGLGSSGESPPDHLRIDADKFRRIHELAYVSLRNRLEAMSWSDLSIRPSRMQGMSSRTMHLPEATRMLINMETTSMGQPFTRSP